MDAGTMKSRLREDLGITKEVIALKQVKEEPSGVEAYRDKNNICFMMAEVLEDKRTFYTTLEDHVCTLGCVATGLDPSLEMMSDEDREESARLHVSAINVFPTEEIQAKAEAEANRLFPKFQEVYKAVIMGPLENVPDPDVFILICGAEQVHRLTRAYCYAVGTYVKGYAGMGACRMVLPLAFLKGEPTFTVSDKAWRGALKIAPDELTLVTPADKLVIMLENLEGSIEDGTGL
jgi:uncharacterized protein (DUF169 family)